jgi:hypothetical protein
MSELTLEQRQAITRDHQAQAAGYLEKYMEEANLRPEQRERLRNAFRGSTNRAGMKQAVNVESRS